MTAATAPAALLRAAATTERTRPPADGPRLTLVPDVRPDRVATDRPRLRLLGHEPDPDTGPPVALPAARPTSAVPADLQETADLRRHTQQVLCLVLEVLGGRRPLAHLGAHLDPPALRYVRAARGQPASARPSRLTSLHVSRPCTEAVEVAAVHRTGARARVLAARFEGDPDHPARWRCVTVRLL